MSECPHVEEDERERSGSVGEEEKDEENEMERQSEGSGGIHEDLIDAVARGTEDPEVLREQDRFLPICNIARVMRRMVPESGKMSKESKEAVQEAVSEFISFITSEASDKCIEEQRKTITCDDLLNAVDVMGFDKYVEPLKLFLKRYRDATRSERSNGEEADGRSPSPSISTSLPIPLPSPFHHSASGPGGPIQPAPPTSIPTSLPTSLLNTAQGPIRISLPPGFALGDKGNIVLKGAPKKSNGQQEKEIVQLSGGGNGHLNGHPTIQPIHPQGPSTSSTGGPIAIFVDQNTGQRYRSVAGQDGTQRLAPIKMMRQQGPPPPQSSSRQGPLPPHSDHSSSTIPDNQSPQISSTTTIPQLSSQSHYLHSNHSSYAVQSHPPSQNHHRHHNPVAYRSSSSNDHNPSMLPPPSSSSTNYIQLMPHSTLPSQHFPSLTTAQLQYTHYQDHLLTSVKDGSNGRNEEKRQMSSIVNTKWNPSSGQYEVDAPRIGGELTTKRRRINNRGQ